MSTPSVRRPLFHEQVTDRLRAAVQAAAAEVPELEAVAVVMLWKLPDQSSVPAVMVQGADGPLVNPDQFLRLHLATLRLEQYCVDHSAQGVVALRALASNLARTARQAHESQAKQEGPGPVLLPVETPAGCDDGTPDHHQA